jgi:hypothetical protein
MRVVRALQSRHSIHTTESPMTKPLFDAQALIDMFQNATTKQSEQLRQATTQTTLAALQGRELTLKNIRKVLGQVTSAASTGAAANLTKGINPEALLDQAVAGMDAAVLKAVDANRVALTTLMAQGADMRDKHLTKALDDLEKMEDAMLGAIKKAAGGAGAPLAGAWEQVLGKLNLGGTLSGTQATSTLEQMAQQMQTAMRSTRSNSLRAAQVLAESYGAMVSGVLIGMADALQPPSAPGKTARK